MPKLSSATIDANLRNAVFSDLEIDTIDNYSRVNGRAYGTILVDDNGNERFCRVRVEVAELREDMTARELMQSEIDKYNSAQAKKAATIAKNREKAAADKAKREKKGREEGE